MKTIEVTDEMYEALMSLSKEMTTQDNRGTATPYVFQIQTMKQVAAYPGQGNEIWVNEDGEELENEEEVRKYISQHLCDKRSDGDEEKVMKVVKGRVDIMDTDDLETYLEKNGWWKVNVVEKEEYENAFFTAKACEDHIRKNNYHYRQPVCYLSHVWRNPELEIVSKFLHELSNNSNSLNETIYEFCYNPSCSDSVSKTISTHKTQKGAETALEFHKHEKLIEWEEECREYPPAKDFPFDYDQHWCINETLLLP